MGKTIPIAFYKVSNYDYHFIIKEIEELKKITHLFSRKHWKNV